MTESRTTASSDGSLARDLLHVARYYLGDRRVMAVLVGATVAIVLAFNWSWVVALGLAPLLVAALPCVAMCALGLCMNKAMGRSCNANTAPPGVEMKNETSGDRAPSIELPTDPIAAGPKNVAVASTARMSRSLDRSEKEISNV